SCAETVTALALVVAVALDRERGSGKTERGPRDAATSAASTGATVAAASVVPASSSTAQSHAAPPASPPPAPPPAQVSRGESGDSSSAHWGLAAGIHGGIATGVTPDPLFTFPLFLHAEAPGTGIVVPAVRLAFVWADSGR